MQPPDLEALVQRFREALAQAASPAQIAAVSKAHTGKKSPVKALLKGLRALSADDRPRAAQAINTAHATMEAEIERATVRAEATALRAQLNSEWQDLTLPGLAPRRGARNPVTVMEDRCLAVLRRLGFEHVDGPEVDSAYYNFDALNIPEHHPARDMQDTFWITRGDLLLRSHTSTTQGRVLQTRPSLPLRIASAGRVYRNEAVDATHLAMFHQVEGLWVDHGLSFAHLKGLLSLLARELYGSSQRTRFKPKFYPYTEPSIGVDLACSVCDGAGCEACHGAGWVTILGAGMVHPKVFLEFGLDPAKVSGIAFGLGTSRMAAQKAGVTRSKSLYEQDLRVHRALHRGQA